MTTTATTTEQEHPAAAANKQDEKRKPIRAVTNLPEDGALKTVCFLSELTCGSNRVEDYQIQKGELVGSSRKFRTDFLQEWPTPGTGPYFDTASIPSNITGLVGKTVMLICKVKNLGNRTVSWVRHRDIHLLTVGRYTYTSDQRFEAMHSPHTEEWTLRIRYAQRKDSGIYECQISTTPPIGHFVYLTVVAGEKWRRVRKLLNPTFNTRMLTSFMPIMDFRASRMVAKLSPLADGKTEVDIMKFVGECTLEMVFSTTMGRNAHELPGQREYIRNLEIIQNLIGERILNANQYLGIFYRMSSSYKAEKSSRDYCNNFTDKIIIERRKELEAEAGTITEDDEFKSKSLNFLDEVLTMRKQDNQPFSDHEISDQLYTMMTAAHDTSALTVAYTCLFLAMYPEVQAKVFAEMNETFHSPSVDINCDTLKQLEYTEMVIKEVLRLCPAVPLAGRETSQEIVLDGVRIPKGQILGMHFYALHRRKDFWGPDPERFDPERFRPEECEKRHPYAYLPFSGGLRNCIGSRYAINSMRIMLLRILQQFELQTNLKFSDFRHKYEITLKLTGPHRVRLVSRNKC
ncbi:probable cytochrome P450 4d14 [Sabethes cyaneus]|uniref:probable cytochrome P450 4d14 n=1 Tax=Sabethes cyaneus TaxID=53552 RepID=UPI00237E7745|nr:probable cytochrome P450 4d14 [Sabethes cyaneus]